MHYHMPNMVSCEVVSSSKRTPLIGTYIPPFTLDHLPDLGGGMDRFRDQDTIVIGDIKADIGQSQNPCSHQVADLWMYFGLVNLLQHFRQHLMFRHLNTWSQVGQSILLQEC